LSGLVGCKVGDSDGSSVGASVGLVVGLEGREALAGLGRASQKNAMAPADTGRQTGGDTLPPSGVVVVVVVVVVVGGGTMAMRVVPAEGSQFARGK